MKKILLFVWAALCIICTSNAQPTANLVAYWPMNGNYTDNGPYAISGTNFGSTATANVNGTVNTAMNFSNPSSTVTQYATHPINANLNFSGTQDFSIDFSIYINDPVVHAGGLYDNNLNTYGYGIWFWNSPGFLQLNFNYKNGNIGTPNGTINANTWYHVCFVRAAGVLRIYVNGALKASGSEGSGVPSYILPARFGTMFFSGYTPPQYNGHNGKLDELRIYSRALTALEIAGLAVLPVKLNSFTATKNNDDVLLRWQTDYEQNSSHFNIQRSIDAVNFMGIASVNAAGNTATVSNYQFTDNTVKTIAAGKTIYYRLEEVDKDGRKKLSDILPVKYNSANRLLTLLQNPVTEAVALQINMPAKENVSIIITNAAAQQLIIKSLQLNAGNNFTTIPVNFLAKGIYTLTLITVSGNQMVSFIK